MKRAICLSLLLLVFCSGCATVPYRYANRPESAKVLKLRPDEKQIERGRPNAFVDVLGWIFGIPSKIILLDSRVDNHRISPQTELALQEYLQRNAVTNVKVRINQYAPGREWSRLVRNKSVGAGWRYTFGVITTLFYTILPGRLFGGDNYNPFTNTINISTPTTRPSRFTRAATPRISRRASGRAPTLSRTCCRWSRCTRNRWRPATPWAISTTSRPRSTRRKPTRSSTRLMRRTSAARPCKWSAAIPSSTSPR